jgi:beta-galactosidase
VGRGRVREPNPGHVRHRSRLGAVHASTQQQLTEVIRQNYNHPAIVFWSIGNEVLLQPGPDPLPVMQNLATVARAEDPTRTVVYAANAGTEANPVDWTPRATFFNEYYGWYYGKVAGVGPWADALHAAHPTTALGMSEYGAGCNPSEHGLPIVETGTDRGRA